ncbi:MAG TPA: PQQ-dependent sugar dehydrogenase [Burkholderiales bacterium]|nr:PQQ-dependent sugar dehydrogenase [Burkholderiales bacterium]
MAKFKALVGLSFIFVGPAFGLESQLVGSGFTQPVFLTAPKGDQRLFVVEKGGIIKTLQNGSVSTYLDISDRVDAANERGLLGMAFDPNFATNGRFYVNYIDKTTLNTVVGSFVAPVPASGAADASSFLPTLTVQQPAGLSNHKAGWIGFRPGDGGNLYIATGDGGSANDPNNRAQNLNDNLGKILRVTPLAGGGYTIPTGNPYAGATPGNDEIWAVGLRNPYRNSFDRLNGDLWIADVGQNTREEINLEIVGTPAGRNYGWRALEGSGDNPGVSDAAPPDAVAPLFDYETGGPMGQTVIGGYVYHGSIEEGLQGNYFFGDFVSGKIFTLTHEDGSFLELTDRTAELGNIFGAFELTSFGEDGFGNLYAVGIDGNVYRIAVAVPEPSTYIAMLFGLGFLVFVKRRLASQRLLEISAS